MSSIIPYVTHAVWLVAGYGMWYLPENCPKMQAQICHTTGKSKNPPNGLYDGSFLLFFIVLTVNIYGVGSIYSSRPINASHYYFKLICWVHAPKDAVALCDLPVCWLSCLRIFSRLVRMNHLFLNFCPTLLRQLLILSHIRFIHFMNQYVESKWIQFCTIFFLSIINIS